MEDAATCFGLSARVLRRWCRDQGHTTEPRTHTHWSRLLRGHPRVACPGRTPLPRAPDGRLWIDVARERGVSATDFYVSVGAGRSAAHAALGHAVDERDLLRVFVRATLAVDRGPLASLDDVRRVLLAVGDALRLFEEIPLWARQRLADVDVSTYGLLVETEAAGLASSSRTLARRVRHRDEVASLLRALGELRFATPSRHVPVQRLAERVAVVDAHLTARVRRDHAREALGERLCMRSTSAWVLNFPSNLKRSR